MMTEKGAVVGVEPQCGHDQECDGDRFETTVKPRERFPMNRVCRVQDGGPNARRCGLKPTRGEEKDHPATDQMKDPMKGNAVAGVVAQNGVFESAEQDREGTPCGFFRPKTKKRFFQVGWRSVDDVSTHSDDKPIVSIQKSGVRSQGQLTDQRQRKHASEQPFC